MYAACSGINADVDFHAEVPLIAFPGLVHLRITLTFLVLGGTGCCNQGRINDSTATHDQSSLIQCFFYIIKDSFAKIVFFEQMSEFQQCCSIRNRFRHEIESHKLPHAVAVIYGVFDSLIRKVKPILQQIHTEHGLYSSGWPTSFSFGIIWLDKLYPTIPRNNRIHRIQKFFLWRRVLPVLVFNIAEIRQQR